MCVLFLDTRGMIETSSFRALSRLWDSFNHRCGLGSVRQREARKAIRTIVCVLVVLIGAMWVAVGSSVQMSHKKALRAAAVEGRNLMIAFREQLGFFMRGIQAEMNVLADRIRASDGVFDMYRWGQESVLVAPGIAQATLIGPDGWMRSTTLEPSAAPIDLSDRESFRAQLDGSQRGVFIGHSVRARLNDGLYIPLTLRIDGRDGRFVGVLSVLVSPEALTNLHKAMDLGPKGVMALTGLDNIILARYSADSPNGTNGVGVSLAAAGRTFLPPNGEYTRYHRATMDSVARIFVDGRVGSYPLVVTVGLAVDDKLEAWHAETRKIVLLALAATVLLVGLGVYLIREIATRAQTEDYIQDLQSELIHVSRLSTMGQMATTLAHELNQPLTAITSYLQGLKRLAQGKFDQSTAIEVIDRIVMQASRAGEVIRRLREFVAKGETDRQPETLNSVVEEAVALALVGARQSAIVTSMQLDASLPPVLIDKVQIQQVVLNLVRNAIEAMEESKRRELTVATQSLEDGRFAGVSIADTGPGIAPEVASRLFQSFTTTKKFGMGVGLSICREIVEAHGGQITAAPNTPIGTVFRVTIPTMISDKIKDAA
jgi:signal transduction histidine kinase